MRLKCPNGCEWGSLYKPLIGFATYDDQDNCIDVDYEINYEAPTRCGECEAEAVWVDEDEIEEGS